MRLLVLMALALATQPALAYETVWRPHPGPQSEFVASAADEVLYGGQAGGGKSAGLVGLHLRWTEHPRYRALILRRDSTQLAKLLDEARTLYGVVGARGIGDGAGALFRFPSGAVVRFTHCEHEKDISRFDGDEFNVLGFDELTHFTERQYRGIRARIRSPHRGLPRWSRSTTNPGGEGHEWVFRRFGAWLDPEYPTSALLLERRGDDGAKLPPARPERALWFVADGEGELIVPRGTPGALSRVFIPASLADNPSLAGTGYERQLQDLDQVRRRQLMDGDWLVRPAAGLLFKRAWFPVLDVVPKAVRKVRRWDFAATEARPGRDPDWTVGALWSRDEAGQFTVEDVVRLRGTPLEVEQLVRRTAEQDGRQVEIVIPQDPGAAGVSVADNFIRMLAGYNVRAERETGSKVERAKPASAQAERGNVRLARGPWNTAWLQEHEAFPEGDHDDQVDTTSGAVAELTESAEPASYGDMPRSFGARRSLDATNGADEWGD